MSNVFHSLTNRMYRYKHPTLRISRAPTDAENSFYRLRQKLRCHRPLSTPPSPHPPPPHTPSLGFECLTRLTDSVAHLSNSFRSRQTSCRWRHASNTLQQMSHIRSWDSYGRNARHPMLLLCKPDGYLCSVVTMGKIVPQVRNELSLRPDNEDVEILFISAVYLFCCRKVPI